MNLHDRDQESESPVLKTPPKGHIRAIHIYPVKSCASISLQESDCNEFGLTHDRDWAIIDLGGNVLTQRNFPRMALIQPEFDGSGTLKLHADSESPLIVSSFSVEKSQLTVELWEDECAAFDEGDEPSEWLSDFLQVRCRLLRYDRTRPRQSQYGGGTRVAFADCCPLLIVSQESLDDLNERMAEPVTMSRFRPSIVIAGLGAYSEDRISALSSGDTILASVKPCGRCVVVTINQENAEAQGPEPLRTLAEYRTQNKDVLFGQYFAASKPGRVHVGDELSEICSE